MSTPPVTMPNLDRDPAQAKAEVDAHLKLARAALSQQIPDGELALKEARLALAADASSIDAAAMIAFAYYHKKLYDTAELVLDELFNAPSELRKAAANLYPDGAPQERVLNALPFLARYGTELLVELLAALEPGIGRPVEGWTGVSC